MSRFEPPTRPRACPSRMQRHRFQPGFPQYMHTHPVVDAPEVMLPRNINRKSLLPMIGRDPDLADDNPAPSGYSARPHQPIIHPTMPLENPFGHDSPLIHSAALLEWTVRNSPHYALESIQKLVEERDQLKREVASISEDFRNSRLDWLSARDNYETLCAISGAKQVILWKYIERLQNDLHNSTPNETSGKEWKEPSESAASESSELIETASMTSIESRGLDPNAQAFVPQHESPAKYMNKVSPADRLPILSTMLSPLQAQISTIPPRWFGICPYSLTSSPCELEKCRLSPICEDFDKGGPACFKHYCEDAHELPTCQDEADGKPCRSLDGPWYTDSQRRTHLRSKVHRQFCKTDEWKIRETIANLKEAHKNRLY